MSRERLILKKFILVISLFPCSLIALYSNKTHLTRRPDSMMLFLEQPLFLSMQSRYKENYGGFISITPSITSSDYQRDLGKYFIFNDEYVVHVGRGTDVDNRYFKLNEVSGSNLAGTISLQPTINQYAIRLDYAQYLDHFIPNTALYIGIPLVSVSVDPNLEVDATRSSIDDKTIDDYFRGDVMWKTSQLDGTSITLQGPLQFGKIGGKRTLTGIANIDVAFEYLFLNKKNTSLALRGHVLFPTDDPASGAYLLEPTLGTGGHWSLGLSHNGSQKIGPNFIINWDARWRYIFSEIERRTIGLKDSNGVTLPWSQYMLVGHIGFPYIEPAANILTPFVRVSPGNTFEGALYFSYNQNHFSFEGGYNLFAKEEERVERKSSFDDTAYALVSSDFGSNFYSVGPDGTVATNAFSENYSNESSTISSLQTSDLVDRSLITSDRFDTSVAQTPASCVHTLFASLSYHKEYSKCASNFGIGVGIDLPSSNAALCQTTFWLKAGCMF